mmetsp:Transcript_150472/g.483649  ORF Transcript_150472/g.483649 Transcript_150472/m.483649 type:complete len:209 (-) Transcript_150472:9958-10584(-)
MVECAPGALLQKTRQARRLLGALGRQKGATPSVASILDPPLCEGHGVGIPRGPALEEQLASGSCAWSAHRLHTDTHDLLGPQAVQIFVLLGVPEHIRNIRQRGFRASRVVRQLGLIHCLRVLRVRAQGVILNLDDQAVVEQVLSGAPLDLLEDNTATADSAEAGSLRPQHALRGGGRGFHDGQVHAEGGASQLRRVRLEGAHEEGHAR